MKHRSACCILISLALTFSASAQSRGSGGGGGTRGPGKGNLNYPGGQPLNIPDLTPRTVFFSGKVVLDDGTALTEPVAIQTVCNGQKHTETYTDSHGGFSFQFSNRSTANSSSGAGIGDAETALANPTAMRGSQRDYHNCELQASLPGFTSQIMELAGRGGGLDNYDLGRIALHRMGQVQGVTISASSAAAPDGAKKAFFKGIEKQKKDKWDEAQKEFEKAVQIYPKFAVAWFELGRVHARNKDVTRASECFQQAVNADPKYASPYQGLTQLALEGRNWPEVVSQSAHLLSLNPINFPDVWLYNSIGNYFLHDLPSAEKSARQGIRVDDEHHVPKLEYMLGMVLMARGQYPEASEHMRSYIKLVRNPVDLAEAQKELEQIQRLSASTVPSVAEKK